MVVEICVVVVLTVREFNVDWKLDMLKVRKLHALEVWELDVLEVWELSVTGKLDMLEVWELSVTGNWAECTKNKV